MFMLSRPASSDFKILVVDDNDANLVVGTGMVEVLGYRYDVAHSGKEALAKLAADCFGLVLMDVQMPDMDGLMTTRLIREKEAKEQLPHLPIIALTAFPEKSDKEKCLAAGMDDYISKPYGIMNLDEKLARYLVAPQMPAISA